MAALLTRLLVSRPSLLQSATLCFILLLTPPRKKTELLQNLVVSSGAGTDPTYHGLLVTWHTAAAFLRAINRFDRTAKREVVDEAFRDS